MLGQHIRKTDGQYFNIVYDFNQALLNATQAYDTAVTKSGGDLNSTEVKNAEQLKAEITRRMNDRAENSMFKSFTGDNLYFSDSFTKKIVGSRMPLDLSDPMSAVARHINDSMHYAYVAPVILDAKRIFSNPILEVAIRRNSGDAIYKQIQSWLNDTANPQRGEKINFLISGLRNYTIFRGLAFNLVTPFYQVAGMGNTVIEIGAADTVKGIYAFIKRPFEVERLIREKSDYMVTRDNNFDPALKEILEGENIVKQAKNKDIKEALYSFIKFMDKLTADASWIGSYNKYIEEHAGDKLGSDQLETDAIEYANGVVDRALGTGRESSLAQMFRDKHYAMRLITLFKTTANADWNYMVDAFDRAANSKTPTGQRMFDLGYVLANFIMRAMLMSLISSGGKFDPKRSATMILTYPFQGVPILGDMIDAFVGIAFKDYMAGQRNIAVSSALDIGKIIFSNDKKESLAGNIGKKIRKVALPSQLNRTYEGMRDLMTGETSDFRRLIWSKYSIGKNKKKKRM